VLLVLTLQPLQLLPEIAFRRLPHRLHAVVNLPLAGVLVMPRLLLAQLVMVQPLEFQVLGVGNPVALLGLELPLFPGVELPRGAGRQRGGSVVQPCQHIGLTGAAFLRQRFQPAA
jgi:hypothetical protein